MRSAINMCKSALNKESNKTPTLPRICKCPVIMSCSSSCCCSVTQSCPNLCDPMDCSTPGLPVPHHFPKFAQFHVHPAISSSDAVFSFFPQSFPASGTFLMSHLFTSDDQNTGVSASASVLPVNSQSWSPLRLTSLISLRFKGLFSPAPQFDCISCLAFCLLLLYLRCVAMKN